MTQIFTTRAPEQKESLIGKTQDMIERDFLNNLKKTNHKVASKLSSNTGNSNDIEEINTVNADTEALLLDLFEVRDGLIDVFEKVGLNVATSSNLASHINKIGSCIKQIGGDVDTFSPLEHVSGLQMPNIVKNAQRVIETTKQCYSLGQITKAEVDEETEGKTISINFEGQDGKTKYTARGVITAESSWKGNEAIDYIYTPGEGRMSVKAFENNKWVDKHQDYNIYWELDEVDITASNEKEKEEIEQKEQNKKVIEEKNVTDDEDIDDSFPIEENLEG